MLEVVCLLLLGSLGLSAGAGSTYYVGTGRYDITGPSVQIEMVRTRQDLTLHFTFLYSSRWAMLCLLR